MVLGLARLYVTWARSVFFGRACKGCSVLGLPRPSQGQGRLVLVGSTSQSWWLPSAVGLPREYESYVGSKQQVEEGIAFWLTRLGAGSWDSSWSSALGTVLDVPDCHPP